MSDLTVTLKEKTMPRTASTTAKPGSAARRGRRHRAKVGVGRRTGRPARRTDASALLAESLIREANWLQLVEQMEDRVAEVETALAGSANAFDAQLQTIRSQADTIAVLTAQGYHVKGLFAALLQRYAGVKLDQQLFNLQQAQQFVDRETASLEAGLESLARNQESRTVEYVATPAAEVE